RPPVPAPSAPAACVPARSAPARSVPPPSVPARPVPAPPSRPLFEVQVGAFKDRASADALAAKLSGRYQQTILVAPATVKGQTFYRVRFIAETKHEAQTLAATLRQNDNPQRGQRNLRLTRRGKRARFSREAEAQNKNSGLRDRLRSVFFRPGRCTVPRLVPLARYLGKKP